MKVVKIGRILSAYLELQIDLWKFDTFIGRKGNLRLINMQDLITVVCLEEYGEYERNMSGRGEQGERYKVERRSRRG